jgi:hypothetical protein
VINAYAILGLNQDASIADVKKAYRRLARKYHPDVSSEPNAKEEFQRIQMAYQAIISGRISQSRSAYSAQERHKERQEQLRRERIRRAREYAKRVKYMQEKQYLETVERASTYFIILLVLGISFFAFDYLYENFKLNSGNTEYTYAKIINANTRNVTYRFYVEGEAFESTSYLKKSFREIVCKNGLPIEVGHYFKVIYNSDHPEYSKLDFFVYPAEVGEAYMHLVYAKLRSHVKFEKYSEKDLSCIIMETYSELGTNGLANLYFYDEPIVENLKHNRLRFYFFIKSQTFESIKLKCLQDTTK